MRQVLILITLFAMISGSGAAQTTGQTLATAMEELGISAWHAAEYHGAGVKIGIIDVGFNGIAQLNPSAVLPDGQDLASLDQGASNHGTLVYAVIAAVAPAAEFYLFPLRLDGKNLAEGVDWMIANGVQVVNYSISRVEIPLDGTNYQAQQMGRLADANIVVVTSAGNHGVSFLSEVFTDANGDGWHEFSGGYPSLWASPMLTERFGETHLRWQDVYTSAEIDLDLYILAPDRRTILDASTQIQQGGAADWAYEDAFYPTTAATSIYIAVRAKKVGSIPPGTRFYLYADDTRLDYTSNEGSITAPADSPKVLAVGALESDNRLWWRSAQGPTWDGRIKPDLVAPTRLALDFVDYPFVGTSASAPLVTGAVALLRGALPQLTEVEVRHWLLTNAQDLGATGTDNQYGYGRLWLPPPSE